MSDKLKQIASGINVAPLLWALQANPQLWNENTSRTQDPSSPHNGLDDIWVRYGKPDQDPCKPHDSVWYPSADLLGIKGMVMQLFAAVGGTRLGGVLITRIPAGKECKPHKDPGWHARFYEKYAIQVASAPGQKFCFDDVEFESKPGDVYWFDNAFTHWVPNPTAYERITVIVCINKE
jgi:Aspartyl/Asparaginyl beta-hydroxylase